MLLFADAVEHVATKVGPVVLVPQVVVCQLLADVAAVLVQLAIGVGPEVTGVQVVAVQLLAAVAVTGVQVCTKAAFA